MASFAKEAWEEINGFIEDLRVFDGYLCLTNNIFSTKLWRSLIRGLIAELKMLKGKQDQVGRYVSK